MTGGITGAICLATPAEVDAFLGAHPQVAVFKAGGCSQTDWALVSLRRAFESRSAGPPLGFVSVLEARAASDHLTALSGIRHESPQVLLFSAGRVVFHRDHGGITESSLAEGLLLLAELRSREPAAS
jgi:bacillithiol system protein YtxJ